MAEKDNNQPDQFIENQQLLLSEIKTKFNLDISENEALMLDSLDLIDLAEEWKDKVPTWQQKSLVQAALKEGPIAMLTELNDLTREVKTQETIVPSDFDISENINEFSQAADVVGETFGLDKNQKLSLDILPKDVLSSLAENMPTEVVGGGVRGMKNHIINMISEKFDLDDQAKTMLGTLKDQTLYTLAGTMPKEAEGQGVNGMRLHVASQSLSKPDLITDDMKQEFTDKVDLRSQNLDSLVRKFNLTPPETNFLSNLSNNNLEVLNSFAPPKNTQQGIGGMKNYIQSQPIKSGTYTLENPYIIDISTVESEEINDNTKLVSYINKNGLQGQVLSLPVKKGIDSINIVFDGKQLFYDKNDIISSNEYNLSERARSADLSNIKGQNTNLTAEIKKEFSEAANRYLRFNGNFYSAANSRGSNGSSVEKLKADSPKPLQKTIDVTDGDKKLTEVSEQAKPEKTNFKDFISKIINKLQGKQESSNHKEFDVTNSSLTLDKNQTSQVDSQVKELKNNKLPITAQLKNQMKKFSEKLSFHTVKSSVNTSTPSKLTKSTKSTKSTKRTEGPSI